MTPPSPSPRVPSPLGALVESLDELDAALKLAVGALDRARLFASQLDDSSGAPVPRPMWEPTARTFAPQLDDVPLTFGSSRDVPDNPDDFPPETLAAYRGGTLPGDDSEGG